MSFKRFDAPLHVIPDEEASLKYGRPMYRVDQAFSFYTGDLKDDAWVHVPKGFLTDGASVPKAFHWLIKPWGRHGQAAVVHDLLCQIPFLHTTTGNQLITFNRTHKIFKEALEVTGNNRVKVFVMYWAVRSYFFFKGYKVDTKLERANLVTVKEHLKNK